MRTTSPAVWGATGGARDGGEMRTAEWGATGGARDGGVMRTAVWGAREGAEMRSAAAADARGAGGDSVEGFFPRTSLQLDTRSIFVEKFL